MASTFSGSEYQKLSGEAPATDLVQKHLLTAPLANPPAPWAPPSDHTSEMVASEASPRCMKVVLAVFEFAGLMNLCTAIALLRSTVPEFGAAFLCFYVCWACILTFISKWTDPGGCYRAIDSLQKGGDDAATAEILVQLRKTPPQVAFMGEASHTQTTAGSHAGDKPSSKSVTTYSAQWYLEYGRWRDVSGEIAGLEKYSIAVVNIRAELSSADRETQQVLDDSHSAIMRHIEGNHRDQKMSCSRKVVVDCPAFPVDGEGMLLSRSPGVAVPCWLNKCVFYLMSLLCMGTLLRILFAKRIPTVVYRLNKEVGVGGGAPPTSGFGTAPGESPLGNPRAGAAAAQTLETPLLQEP